MALGREERALQLAGFSVPALQGWDLILPPTSQKLQSHYLSKKETKVLSLLEIHRACTFSFVPEIQFAGWCMNSFSLSFVEKFFFFWLRLGVEWDESQICLTITCLYGSIRNEKLSPHSEDVKGYCSTRKLVMNGFWEVLLK